MKRPLALALALCLPAGTLPAETWDVPAGWSIATDGRSTARLDAAGEKLKVSFELRGPGWGWVEIGRELPAWDPARPFTFLVKNEARGHLEVKWTDADGSTFL